MHFLTSLWNRLGRQLAIICLLLLVAGSILGYRLGTLNHGASAAETVVATQPVTLDSSLQDPLGLPLHGLRYIVFSLAPSHGQLLLRLPNIVLGLIAMLCFVAVCKRWYGSRSAVFGGAIMLCSAWYLHVARIATDDVLYLCLSAAILLLFAFARKSAGRPLSSLLGCLILTSLLFIPGGIWFVATYIIFDWKQIRAHLSGLATWWLKALVSLLPLPFIGLLVYAFVHHPRLSLTWLGLPQHAPSVIQFLKSIAAIPYHLFIHGPNTPVLWLDGLPLLNAFIAIATLAGLLFYLKHYDSFRTRILLVVSILAVLLIAAGGPISLAILIAPVFMFALTGVTYILHEWLKIFPRNPLARGFAISLLGLAIVFSCSLNLRSYFVAWPHAQSTKAAFSHRLK